MERILQAGRVAGNGKNSQDRRLIVLRDSQQQAAEMVTRPGNVRGAVLVVAIVIAGESNYGGFDAGRAAQNMMLAAWSEGVASCPNAITDRDGLDALLGIASGEQVAILLGFGLPAKGFDPSTRSAEEWREAADRIPIEELVEYR